MADSEEGSSKKKITVFVKTPKEKEKQKIEIDEDATILEVSDRTRFTECHYYMNDVLQFRGLAAAAFGAKPEEVSFIFAGKIMKDTDNLKMHNIKDGFTIHMVIKQNRPATTTQPNTAPTPSCK